MADSVQNYRAECTAAFKAQALMRGWGGIAVGTLSADFGLTELSDNFGWVVTGYHDNILTFVFPDQGRDKEKLIIGLLGYSERTTDAESLKTVYIEDNRGA